MTEAKPPRSAMTMRHMLMALGVLVLVALAVGGLTRACSFAPAGPSVDPNSAPRVDAPADLARYAKEVPFPVRIPAVPAGWHANSSGVDPTADPGAARVVRVGYITPEGRYLRLLQGDVPEEAMLRVETGTDPVSGQGPVTVGTQQWVVYGGSDREPIWIADTGAARLLITGSGTDQDFRALAGAAQAGPVAHPCC